MTLARGVRFADGHRVDAEDVCFSIEAILNPANPVPWAGEHRRTVTGCDVVDRSTAVVHFARRVPDPREWLDVAILPAHAFASTTVPVDHPFAREAFGSIRMTASLDEERVVYRRTSKQAPPHLRVFEQRWDLGVEDVVAGRAHGMLVTAREDRPRLDEDTLLSRRFDTRDAWFLLVNPRGPLSLLDTRVALDRAIDRDELRATVWGDEAADPNPLTDELTGPVRLSSPLYNRSVEPRASSSLPPGLLQTLRLGVGEAQEAIEPGLGAAIAAQLRGQGVTVELVPLPGDPLTVGYDRGVLRDLDLLVGRWVSRMPNHLRPLFHPEGSHNVFEVHSDALGEHLAALESAVTSTAYAEAAHGLQRTSFDEVFAIWLVSGGKRSVWTSRLRSNIVTPLYYWSQFGTWRLER